MSPHRKRKREQSRACDDEASAVRHHQAEGKYKTSSKMRDRPLAGSDQIGTKGRGLPANHPRSVGRWVREAAMGHRGGSRLGGTTAVRSVGTLQLRDGILYRNFVSIDGQVRWKQLLVPRSPRALQLQHLHAEPTAGHIGVKNTQDRVMKMAY